MNKYLKYIYPYDWLVAGYFIFSIILAYIFGMRIDYKAVLQYKTDMTFFKLVILYLIIYVSFLTLRYRREGKDDFICGRYWRKRLQEKFLKMRNLVDLFRVLVLLKLTLLIYCNIKQAIPFINPELYDSQLLLIDEIIHFGLNPNILSVDLLGNDYICEFMDRIYISWYMLKPLVLAYFVFIPDRKTHIRFFTSYFALWIFGGLFSLIMPSLGPIYVFPSWFSDLHKPFASGLQRKLILNYDSALANPDSYKVYIYEGVAAFPSLHVGIVALFTFFIYKINKKLGIIMIVYTLMIQLGSILLGWHYAVDGYFSIFLAWYIFKVSEFLVKDKLKTNDHPASLSKFSTNK